MKTVEFAEAPALAPHLLTTRQQLMLTDNRRTVAMVLPADEADVQSLLLPIGPAYHGTFGHQMGEYFVALQDCGQLGHRHLSEAGVPGKCLTVFSNRDMAVESIRNRPHGEELRLVKVDLGHLQCIFQSHANYTHVDLDGRQLRLEEFKRLIEHERLE